MIDKNVLQLISLVGKDLTVGRGVCGVLMSNKSLY